MDKQERVDMVRDAYAMVAEAYELVRDAIAHTDIEAHTKAYGVCGLERALGFGNPYDESLDDVIEALEGLEG